VTNSTGITVDNAPSGLTDPDIHVGLIGQGIGQSRTPKMHIHEGTALGLRYCYDLLDVAQMPGTPDIGGLLALAEAKGWRGVNVTHPFKQQALAHLDHLSEAAQAVNAVNTVVFQDGKRYGHNTDYWGFAQAFRLQMSDVRKQQVLLLGAGGAGGAVANALLDNGVQQLTVFDPAEGAAEALAQRLAARVGPARVRVATDVSAAVKSADGLVNASPVGMAKHPGSPVPLAQLSARQWVADIIYFPLETQLLAAARTKGCRVMDGSGMALYQAVRAFELFSGLTPDPARMRETFDSFTTPAAGPSGA
jgi:shikimate dehydrogenase